LEEWEEVRVRIPTPAGVHAYKGFNGGYRVKLTPDKLRNFCEIDWPTFGVGWLLE
jgi:hypothetical protein